MLLQSLIPQPASIAETERRNNTPFRRGPNTEACTGRSVLLAGHCAAALSRGDSAEPRIERDESDDKR